MSAEWTIVAAIWLVLGVVGLSLLVFYDARYSQRARIRRRVRVLVGEAINDRGVGGSGSEAANSRARQKLIQGKLRELENQRQRSRRNELRQLLLQADARISVAMYILICFGLGILVGLILLLVHQPVWISAIGGGGAGLMLPRWVLKMEINRRQKAFTTNFADALDILVRGTRTGLPVGECLRIVGREVPDPVGEEFRMLVESQRLGITLDQTLDRALERMPTTELQFFAIVLLIQQQTGGNLAGTLENLSHVLRQRKQLRDKVAALSSEAKASAMIIGSLPFIVGSILFLVNPNFVGLLFWTKIGNIMLAGGGVWMMMGILVMRGMINFNI